MVAERKSILKDMLIRTTGASKLSKYQNFGEAIQPCIVYWRTTNLKDDYAPSKITKKFSFLGVWDRVLPNTKFHFSRYLIGGGNVL